MFHIFINFILDADLVTSKIRGDVAVITINDVNSKVIISIVNSSYNNKHFVCRNAGVVI